jgi:hypothetical protein
MRTLLIASLATLFAVNMALAADPSCEGQAAEKKLAGAAKSSFMKKCEADAKPVPGNECEARASGKKLAGAAKSSFMKKCEADAKPAPGKDCEARASEKKLAGAARSSFVKKCVQEAGAAGQPVK